MDHGIIALQIKNEPDSLITLIPNEYIDPDPIPQAITKQAESFANGMLAQTAIVDF